MDPAPQLAPWSPCLLFIYTYPAISAWPSPTRGHMGVSFSFSSPVDSTEAGPSPQSATPRIYDKAIYIVAFNVPKISDLTLPGFPHMDYLASWPHLPQVANSSLGILVSLPSLHSFYIPPSPNLSQKNWHGFGLVLERSSHSLPLEEGSSEHRFWFISILLCPFKTPFSLQ